jgi:hypothetical protein
VAVPLGTATAFSVLAGSTVTNTGTTTIDRSVGVSPGSAITGASTMTIGGTYHQADAVALDAKNDLTTAYNTAAGEGPTTDPGVNLGGLTLVGGVYNRSTEMAITGTVPLTLDGGVSGPNAHSNSVWVFQAGSTLTTASASSIVLTGGADACNIFWQVGSSATFGTTTHFVGTVMAQASITMNTGATLEGRVLARSAAVNLHANVITSPTCGTDTTVTPGSTTPTTTPTATTPTSTPTPTPKGSAGGTGGAGGGSGGSGLTTNQIKKTPNGSVDTGVVGSKPIAHHGTSATMVGWTLAVGFGGLALVAVRRRRRV